MGGPYTVEALAFGASSGITIAAAILAAAPFSLLLQPHDVMDALPPVLARTGTTIAASMNLVPAVVASFTEVSEAQRMRGWRPRGPRSWAEVVVPVVLTSVESSIQLAESMEARGFGLPARTHFRGANLGPASLLVIVASLAAAAQRSRLRNVQGRQFLLRVNIEEQEPSSAVRIRNRFDAMK